jgi:hypothetical protein
MLLERLCQNRVEIAAQRAPEFLVRDDRGCARRLVVDDLRHEIGRRSILARRVPVREQSEQQNAKRVNVGGC